MVVHDFSSQGRARYLRNWVNEELGGVRTLSSTGTITGVEIPWADRLDSACSGHDSLLFPAVSVVILCFI